MADRPTSIEQRLREAFDQSVETVRKAHERAERAARRARLMRATMKRLQARPAAGSSSASALRLAIEEHERSARENERFIAIVSHELRQPLNAIVAAYQILVSRTSPTARHAASQVMERQLRHMTRLIDDLLELSRLSVRNLRLERHRIELMPVVEAAIETVAGGITAADLIFDVTPADGIVVNGDRCRLQQVLSNILSKAVRYTPAGGRVSVTVSAVDGTAVVRIADTGQGIDAADLNNIFEPFARGGRASAEGFGIGLALVKGLVELHGGRVHATSPGRGRGSTFEVTLSIADETPSRAE